MNRLFGRSSGVAKTIPGCFADEPGSARQASCALSELPFTDCQKVLEIRPMANRCRYE